MSDFAEIDLTKIKTHSILKRRSKISQTQFAAVSNSGDKISDFFKKLPEVLKASDFNSLIDEIVLARRKKKPVIFMLGAHVIKCGLSTVIIDLIQNNIVSGLALNGAGAIHDFEIALLGQTSEDVLSNLATGDFGMAKETAYFFNTACRYASINDLGLGEGIGKILYEKDFRFKDKSVLVTAHKSRIPATVHISVGTDIVHQHPNFDAQATGEASFKDFKILCGEVKDLKRGGVVVNIGSAVILPEVFLKALSVARNIYGKINNFTTAVFDMLPQYRAQMNVVERPTYKSGKGFYFAGHHEIMIPLLAAGIKSRLKK